jgi:hypothetical protein
MSLIASSVEVLPQPGGRSTAKSPDAIAALNAEVVRVVPENVDTGLASFSGAALAPPASYVTHSTRPWYAVEEVLSNVAPVAPSVVVDPDVAVRVSGEDVAPALVNRSTIVFNVAIY